MSPGLATRSPIHPQPTFSGHWVISQSPSTSQAHGCQWEQAHRTLTEETKAAALHTGFPAGMPPAAVPEALFSKDNLGSRKATGGCPWPLVPGKGPRRVKRMSPPSIQNRGGHWRRPPPSLHGQATALKQSHEDRHASACS